jgi:signal transduction histidine kinase
MLLLLGGAVDGMLSYHDSMKAINSKLEELKYASEMQQAFNRLNNLVDRGGKAGVALVNHEELKRHVLDVRAACERYRVALDYSVLKGWDPDNGKTERKHLSDIQTDLASLLDAAGKEAPAQFSSSQHEMDENDKKICMGIEHLGKDISAVPDAIRADCDNLRASATDDERTTLALVIGTSVLGFVLMIFLARQAYRWLVDPIRELHDKVARLAQGNFDSRIVVQSGDEIQDLAAAFNDMTDRLHSIYSDLERQVNERSRQLVRSESLAGVGFLAAGVAHEINNPLASIAFCGEALERRLREMLAGKRDHPDMVTVNNYLKMIQDEAFRCKDITQKLLEFSRIGDRQRQMTDLAQIIQSVIDMVHLHQNYKGKNIDFVPIENPALLINDQEIKSVVLNLVANALDSMEVGGTLNITLNTQGNSAVMTFTDTGCGMAPDVLENLFEPFFSRSRTGKGIGLGLSISHRIITQHGGEIEATSAGPNLGSTFTVKLPLTSAAVDVLPLTRAA